jgi:hypothetical protein
MPSYPAGPSSPPVEQLLLDSALFHVGWAPEERGWEIDELTLPKLNEEHALKGDRLFFYIGDEDQNKAELLQEKSWMYLIPIGAVRSRADIIRLIINPVFALVRGSQEAEAFADAPEVISFEEAEGEIRPKSLS